MPKAKKALSERTALDRREAAEYLGVSKLTLDKWAQGIGPNLPFFKPGGKKAVYLKRDLDAFLEGCRVNPGENSE